MDTHSLEQAQAITITNSFFSRTYAWMASALLVTAITAYYLANYQLGFVLSFATDSTVLILLFIAQIGLVIYLSARIHKMSVGTAIGVFYFYALTLGITLSTIFLVYTMASITSTFVITAGMFGAMALIGVTTKIDLTKFGSVMLMALIGIILASLVNFFLQSSTLYWIVTYAGVVIFAGLTAYDNQRLMRMSKEIGDAESDSITKIAIMGALALYLDFINLFLFLLRIFGSRD